MESESEQRRDQGETGQQRQDDKEDLVRLLPDDALAAVLRRLAPRDLAASRCVRKTWHRVIDDHNLLHTHLLPLKLSGIFINFNNLESCEFFARPTTGAKVSGEFDFLPRDPWDWGIDIEDHCNGLFLWQNYVFNPATRRSTLLPSRPPQPASMSRYFYHREYLVFDPMVSPHFEVFMIPRIACTRDGLDPAIEQSEWLPSPWILNVFSSRTGQWEERSFIRDGDPAGTVGHMRKELADRWHYAAYSHGELYVHCEADFVTRFSLSKNMCQTVKPPADVIKVGISNIGKSEKGVYCASVDGWEGSYRLRVWRIKEFCGRMEWVLVHQSNLGLILARLKSGQPYTGPWILQDINYHQSCHEDGNINVVQEDFEWDSDNDNVLQAEEGTFHTCMAYHWNDSKVQYLESAHPRNYSSIAGQHQQIWESFPYTPCWMEECPPGK